MSGASYLEIQWNTRGEPRHGIWGFVRRLQASGTKKKLAVRAGTQRERGVVGRLDIIEEDIRDVRFLLNRIHRAVFSLRDAMEDRREEQQDDRDGEQERRIG